MEIKIERTQLVDVGVLISLESTLTANSRESQEHRSDIDIFINQSGDINSEQKGIVKRTVWIEPVTVFSTA